MMCGIDHARDRTQAAISEFESANRNTTDSSPLQFTRFDEAASAGFVLQKS